MYHWHKYHSTPNYFCFAEKNKDFLNENLWTLVWIKHLYDLHDLYVWQLRLIQNDKNGIPLGHGAIVISHREYRKFPMEALKMIVLNLF